VSGLGRARAAAEAITAQRGLCHTRSTACELGRATGSALGRMTLGWLRCG